MRIIYAVCSWGLGHATRSLPVIRKLLDENNELTIISNGRSLELLKRELYGDVEYFDIADYPILLSENSRQFIAKSVVYWPKFISRIESGLNKLKKILENKKYDKIISDGRYDIYSKKISSFLVTHQIRIMNPLRVKTLEKGSEIFNLFFFKRFAGVIVPDYKDDDLSGDLSHNLNRIDENKLHYVGVLSDFKKKHKKKDIDYFISISGPEPQRSIFERKIFSQIDDLEGRILITLGKTESTENTFKNNIEIFTFLSREKREDFLNRSKLIISRSGYSTIMDLGVVKTKACIFPTPGQIEQEYLADYHNEKGTFNSANQNHFDLKDVVEIAKKKTGINTVCDVDKTIEKIMNVVNTVEKSPFI
jgi:uncharacterized protein (TIGR00661 family)